MPVKHGLRSKLHSLNYRVMVLTLLPLLMLTLLLVAYNSYAISVLKRNTYEVNSRALDVYMNNVDESMRTMDYYWVGLQTSSNLLAMITSQKDTERAVAISRLKTDMASVVQSYKFIDSLFIYSHDKDEYFEASKYSLKTGERRDIKALTVSEIDRFQQNHGLDGKWQPAQIDGRYYLIRVLQVHDTYIGGCISVSRLLSSMEESGFSDIDYLTFFGNNDEELGQVLPTLDEPLGVDGSFRQFSAKAGKSNYLAISRPSAYGSYSAVVLLSDVGILEGLSSFQTVALIWIACIIIFLIAFIVMMRRWISAPIRKLCEAMNSLKSGNLDVRIGAKRESCSEFALVNETFDDMSENIKSLKIDVYEQKTQRQAAEIRQKSTELQYMKEQMRPHFYINCLNVIHNLSLLNKNQQIDEMTTYLSNQLRYVMSSKTVDTLQREIDFVKNYLKIQQLCRGEGVHAHIEVDPSAGEINVPPLLIMTFVENTCKHQAIAGERIDIYIVCTREEAEAPRLRIEIWDSGDGYPDYVLDCIRDGQRILDERGEHFGIWNVIARLNLIFGDDARIEICNHWETGGAYAIIELPENTAGSMEDAV